MSSAWVHWRIWLLSAVLSIFCGKAWSQAPSIDKLSVNQGEVGTSVTITGTNFGSTGTVTFNGTTATPTTWTSSSIVVPVPANASTGDVVVTVTISGTLYPSNGMWFTVTWSAPVISLSPNSGPVGTPVTISGNNFGASQLSSTVTFNGTPAVVTNWSSTSLSTTVPSGASTGNVVVTVDGQMSTPATFTVTLPVPNITSISPTGAPVATSVTINGANFGTGTNSSVTFNGTSATPTNWTNTAITVPVPSASSGNVVVTVSGEASNGVYFTVLPAAAPEITGFSVPSAITGASITIQGKNFGSSGSVTFNGVAGTSTNWTATAIQIPVPSGAATGPVVVTVNSVASNPTTFTVLPQIISIVPTSGPGNSVVKLNGTGFGATVGTNTVTLSGQPCSITSWSDLAIEVELPSSDSVTGPIIATVGGAASNGQTFTVQFNGTITGTVTNVSTGAGISAATVKAYSGGALVATGSSNTSGVYTISNVASGTYMLVFSASGFPPQTIPNVAVPLGGTATINASLGTPAITTIAPTSGPTGTVVTITGSNFGAIQASGSNVTFNAVSGKITTWSNTTIVATVPSTATTGPAIVKVGGISSNSITFTVGTGTISGTVKAATGGTAINGASVQALQTGSVIGSTTSSSTGAYSIASLPAGSYDVRVTASTYGDSISAGNAVTANNTTTVNVAMPAPGTIAGTITQSNGSTAISGATVGAYQGYDAAGTATANSSGAYSIPGLGPGTYTVTVSATGYDSQNVNSVTVTAGNTTTENVSLTTQPTIAYEYDQAGRLVAVVNSTGNAAAYNYDAAGNVQSIAQNAATKVTITDFIPNNGPVGTVVTIYGTGFSTTPTQNTVKFNGTTATVTSSTSTQIVTKVPTGATTGTISVTSPGGNATSSNSFTVTTTNGLPTITSFSPSIGTPTTAVTVTGTNYSTTAANDGVRFNGAASPVSSSTATTLSTSVPTDGTSGHITASNGIGTVVSTADFFVPPSPFTVSNVVFTGRMTLGGTGTVTITTANDIGLMLFDGTAGEGASFSLSSTFSNFTTTIIAPGGAQIATVNTGSTSSYLEVPNLPVTGTYTIMVQGVNTGSVAITSYIIPANVSKTFAIGGSGTNVATTVPGQNIDLTFTGSVTQQVTLYLSAITYTGCNSLNVTIFNPDNSTLTTGTVCNGTTLYIDLPTLQQSGTYTVFIDPQGATIGGLTATLYNAAATKATITEGGSPVTVTIAQPGQQANISFSGKQGDQVSLLMSSVTIPSSNVYIQNTASLKAGTQYNIEMDYFQNTGPAIAQLWYSSNSTPLQIIPSSQLYTPGGTAGGLQGDYFTDTTLEGYPQVRRTDATVDFNWTNTSPDPSIPEYNFGARWTGFVQAQYSENYTFCTLTDDGARLYINGSLVINEWQAQAATQWCSNDLATANVGTGGGYIDVITLPATGSYNILLVPQNNATGSMTFTLNSVTNVSSSISPNGTPVVIETTVPGQNAMLTFAGTAGQRLSLLMSGVTIPSSNVTIENTATLTAGQKYPLQMQYFQGGGGALAYLRWYSPSTVKNIIPASQLYPQNSNTSGGLSAQYITNPLLEGAPTVTRIDPTINFNWSSQGPDPSVPQTNFSANWTGSVEPVYSENYTFCTTTDDGARLYINSSLFINNWQTGAGAEFCSNNLGAYNGVGTGGAFIDDFIIPVTGTYTILVDPQGSNTGNMTLTLYDVATDFASPITPGGAAVNVQTTTPGQNAQLTFTGTAGQRVSLLMAPGTISSSNVSVVNTGAPFAIGQQVPVEMEYYQGTGGSTAQLWYYSNSTVKQVIPTGQLYPSGSGTSGGLQGNYFNNEILGGTPVLVRTDPDINFNWNGDPPDPSVTGSCSVPGQCFSTRWLGTVQTQYNEVYTFCTTTDDGSLLWINNSLMVNDWQGQGATEYCGGTWGLTSIGTGGGFIDTITLPASGTYTIPIAPQGSATGSMQFTLYNVPADVTGNLTINGTAQNVTITTPGQNGELTFSGTAGQLLTVHITNNTINQVTVSLLNPDGTTATSSESGSSSFNLTQQTLGTTGTYTVKIDPQGSVIGSLSVQVTNP